MTLIEAVEKNQTHKIRQDTGHIFEVRELWSRRAYTKQELYANYDAIEEPLEIFINEYPQGLSEVWFPQFNSAKTYAKTTLIKTRKFREVIE